MSSILEHQSWVEERDFLVTVVMFSPSMECRMSIESLRYLYISQVVQPTLCRYFAGNLVNEKPVTHSC